jgi:hypothetical protein
MRRCVLEFGIPAVCLPPNVPQPHPDAPDRLPEIRVPKHLSHPDFHPLYAEAQRLGIGLGIHEAPGFQLAGWTSDQLDSFTLVHVFANRSMQQMALARLIFDGVMEAFPGLRFGFLEAGAGWLPDFMHNLHEHWEKRIRDFDPSVEPGVGEFLVEFAREPNARGKRAVLTKARGLMRMLFTEVEERLQSLLGEIWIDETLHVAYLRGKLGPISVRASRLLLPAVVLALMKDVPQLRKLGCTLGELYWRARTALEIPPAIEWMEADPRVDA